MTISTEVRKAGPFIGNGSASVFPFAFKVFKAADLIVVRRQDNIGTETTLVLDSDYHVTLNSNQDTTPGGVVTLVAGALAPGFTLVVSSELPYLQPTDLTNQGGFYPKVITNALDRLTIFCQQLAEITGRTLKLPITAPTDISAEIPLPNPSELIAWDETGTRLTTVSPQSLVTSIAYGSATADLFAGDGATTTFPLSTNPASVNNLDVSVGGFSQRPVQGGIGDYSWNGGASITFVTPPPAPTVPGDKNVLVRYMQAIPVSDSEALHAQTREALRRGYAEAGYNLVDGSFETGGTLTAATDVLLQESTGAVYAWTGSLPEVVAPGFDPVGAAGFELRTDVVLRTELYASMLAQDSNVLALKNVVYINAFGDVDAVTDHREIIQRGLDYVALHGGTLVFPPRDGGYTIASEHPSYPGCGLVLDITSKPDQYTRGGVSLLGHDWDSRVTLNTATSITSLLYVPGSINYLRMKGMWFDANKKADYCFQASDDYNPFMQLEHCKFYKAKLACARISTFVSQFTGCFFGESDQDGLRLVGIGSGPVTSVTMTGCYAIRNARRGYDFGYLTYCTLNSCAADRNALAYYFNIASGVTMNACGAETCGSGIQVNAYRGFAINTFYMLSVGSEDPLNPAFCLIEFGSGYGATVQGIRKESSRYQTYLLASTAASTGYDNITVLDGSVNRDTAYWVPSTSFVRPIKFLRGDQAESTITVNISTAQQFYDLAERYRQFGLNYDLTINLADGDYDLTSLNTLFSTITGSGTLYIKGNSSTPTSVRIITNANMLKFFDISARLYLKDLAIAGTVVNNSYKRITFNNCKNVILDRVVVQKNDINVGVGIENVGSNIFLMNGAGVDSTSFATGAITVAYGGSVTIEPLDADPANPGWFAGAKYYIKTPVSAGPVGKVWVSAAVGWKGFGSIL